MAVNLINTILTNVKRRASIPDQQDKYNDTDLVAFAQQALNEVVYPWYIGINEEFGIVKKDYPAVDSSNVTYYPDSRIPIPARAFGRNLREIKYRDAAGTKFNVPLVMPEDQDIFQYNASTTTPYYGCPRIMIRGDDLIFLALPSQVLGTFEIAFPVEPPALASSTTLSASVINVAYASGVTTITTQTPGADFTAYLAASGVKPVDIFRVTSGQYVNVDLVATRTGTGVTFTTTDLTQNEANNLMAYQLKGASGISSSGVSPELILLPAGQNNYMPMPSELEPFFTLAVISQYMESQGDIEGLQVVEAKMKKATDNALKVMGKRITGETKRLVNARGLITALRRSTVGRWY